MPDSTLTTPPTGGMRTAERESADSRDLARFGYKQELKRILGPYSSFAVAFSYISPSTGIFTLYFLGLSIGGAFFFWSWPLVALGQFIVAAIILIPTTALNIYGVRLVAIVNNTGVVFEILGMLVFALVLLIFYHHQSAGVVFNTQELGSGFGNQAGTFLAAMFMSLFVIYGFDTASTLAEETNNPRREAPRAVLAAVIGAFIIGAIFLYSTIIAIPGDVDKYVANTAAAKVAPPVDIITSNLPGWAGELYLVIVFLAIYVCCLAIQTSTIRLAFGMARDGKLPFARLYNRVSPRLHTPVWTCVVVGALSAVPYLYYSGAGLVAIAATGMIYFSYLLGNIAILIARTKGWPTERAPFKLGGWGTIVNVLGLVWGGSMLINFLWPRAASNPNLSALPNFPNLGAIGNIPIFEATILVIVVVGAIYYLVAQRGKIDQVVP